jgi:hypothetical protein
MAQRDRRRGSTWQRFLQQRTVPQRLLLAVAGIVGAVAAIAAAVVAVGSWVGGDDDGDDRGGGGDGSQEQVVEASELDGVTVESGTDDADELVRFLVAADGGDPVALDLTVLANGDEPITSHLALWYNCEPGAIVGDGACNKVRLAFPADNQPPQTRPLGWRFASTYRITVSAGVDYGQDLDLSFDDISA